MKNQKINTKQKIELFYKNYFKSLSNKSKIIEYIIKDDTIKFSKSIALILIYLNNNINFDLTYIRDLYESTDLNGAKETVNYTQMKNN